MYRQLVDGADNGVVVLNAEGQVLYANPASTRMLGPLGAEVLQTIPDSSSAVELAILDGLGRAGGVGALRIVPIRWQSKPARLATIHDVSARVACEHKLSEDLADVRRDLDDLSFVVSHDLKGPLRGVSRLAQWIVQDLGKLELKGSIGAEIRENLGLLVSRVDRMHGYLASIIAYFRVESAEGKQEDIDVRALLESIVPMLNAPEGFAIEILGDIPHLFGEQAPIELLFMHLLSNAVKHHHNHAQGRVVVRARTDGERVEYDICDNGPGIPEEFRERVFRVFQTLKSRDRVEGAGIGLAIVKKLLNSVGGTIAFRDHGEEPGISLRVSLPRNLRRRTTGRLTSPRRSPMPFPRPVP